jgi:hypothetical protein
MAWIVSEEETESGPTYTAALVVGVVPFVV